MLNVVNGFSPIGFGFSSPTGGADGITEMHSQGHSRAQIWQPVQTGSATFASHKRPGGPWKRGARGMRSFGYWTVTGRRKRVRRVV